MFDFVEATSINQSIDNKFVDGAIVRRSSDESQAPENNRLCCQNDNNVEQVYHKILSFQQSRNKLNMFKLFLLCRNDEISFDIVAETGNIVAKKGNNVEATFDFVEKKSFGLYHSTMLLRHCCWCGRGLTARVCSCGQSSVYKVTYIIEYNSNVV